MDWIHDQRTDCWSVLITIQVEEYILLAGIAHSMRGAIQGQRDVLKTTTARRIRERMVTDIIEGAVLPPIVIGAMIESKDFALYPNKTAKRLADILPTPDHSLSIIDGMQRTAALLEAVERKPEIKDKPLRVELWLAKNFRAMIYRMLVLNTGQVPWTLSRQLAVVYDPLVREVSRSVPSIDKIYSVDAPGRRVAPAQYAADDIVELYLAFSLRKTNLDTKEALSEEFSRLDFVQNLSDIAFQDQFYLSLRILAETDKAFSRFAPEGKGRFYKGRHIFDGQPSRIGFLVSIAQYILGRSGEDRSSIERGKRADEIAESSTRMLEALNNMAELELGEYLKLDVLAEILDRRVGQVGRYERAVFVEAFKVLVEEKFEVPNLEICWRAH